MNRINIPTGVLPSWKNSPIKTVPSELRRISVPNQKPPTHKGPRKFAIAAHSESSILRDVSSMFDDDGDELLSVATEDNPFRSTSDEDVMKAMFASPNQSTNNSFNNNASGSKYYWDRIENQREEYSVSDDYSSAEVEKSLNSSHLATEHADSMGTPPDLTSALREASLVAFEYKDELAVPINLQLEISRNSFLLEHIQFLVNFDQEIAAHISAAHSTHSTKSASEEDEIDYERELTAKLDHYLALPEEVLHALVMRQHEEIVQLGIFNNSD